MEDRLRELRRVSAAGTLAQPPAAEAAKPEPAGGLFGKRKASAAAAAAPAGGDIEMGAAGGKQFMEGFFQDVESVKGDIQAIKEAIRRMGEIQAEALVAQNAKEAELSKLLQDVIHETNPRAQRAKAMLQKMKEETAKVAGGKGTSEFRIRDNLTNTLTRKFVETMKDYQNAQSKYKTFVQKKVVRQVHIVKPEATAEEIDAVMRSGMGADQIITQAILKGADQAVRNVYRDVADKYQDVLTLEASIAELHQMFLDFSLLVDQQGELLDQIEYNVAKSDDYVAHANESVVTAIQHAKKSRKYTCCMLIFVMMIVVAAVLAIFVFKWIKI